MRSFFFLGLFLAGFHSKPAAALQEFCSTYETCRSRFARGVDVFQRTLSPEERLASRFTRYPVPSATDSDLYIDVFFQPATEAQENLAIVVLGAHGPELKAGTRVAVKMLEEYLPKIDRTHFGVLFVHALNPWGAKNDRRVNENGVDLNRNFQIDPLGFKKENPGYDKMSSFLNPSGKVSTRVFSNLAFLAQVAKFRSTGVHKDLRRALLGGQHSLATGLYYGGSQPEPEQEIFDRILKEFTAPYRRTAVLDVHTGYGQRGTLHLMPDPAPHESMELTESLFRGFTIEDTHGEDFYPVTGNISTYVAEILARQSKKTTSMVLEYGTVNNHRLRGELRSLQVMIRENQLYHHGAADRASEAMIRQRFWELYFPSAESWRRQFLNETDRVVPKILRRLARQGKCDASLRDGDD